MSSIITTTMDVSRRLRVSVSSAQKALSSTSTPTPPPVAPAKFVMKPISASVKVNTAGLTGETLKELHSKITLDTHFGHHLREIGHQRGNRPKNNHLLNGSRTVTEQRPASTKAATVMEQRDNRR